MFARLTSDCGSPRLVELLARAKAKSRGLADIWLGVLFENSIVCHVFYAIWSWGLRMVGFCLLCVVFGACFVLVCLAPVVGVGWGYVVWFSGLFTDCCSGLASCFVVWGLVGVLLVLFGEFDPGSGRTLAACLTHASRTVKGPAFVGPG